MQKILIIALGGALGTVSRYGLGGLVQRMAGGSFPLGTMVVNMLGSFLFGLVFGFLETRLPLNAEARMILLTGFMGAFTTYSTFMFESHSMLRYGQWASFMIYLVGQIVLGLALVHTGLYLARKV
ncbi:MAG: fluoride efflux transporter CrcB [Desulfovibrio sp.]|uniref:fluoride efflux transporter CrcB n=1 Tax=Desulfovibrio sp. 7SRBS1 TaxID=3378064 RepID=UPI003B3CBC89